MRKMKFWGALLVLASRTDKTYAEILKNFFESYNNPPEEKDAAKIQAFCAILMTDLYASGYALSLPA